MKSEHDFLQLLEERASQEKKIVQSGILPSWAASFGEWLGVNPWRLLVPSAVVIYLLLRVVGGETTREVVLALFGGFRW